MAIRYFIATALMASACAAHADVIPSSDGAGIMSGSNVAGAVGNASVIAGVSHGANSDALVQELFRKVSASVGHDMKVSLKQGVDGVYVTGLSTAKAAALAGDGMSVIMTPDGFKIVQNTTPAASAPVAANDAPVPVVNDILVVDDKASAPPAKGAADIGVGNQGGKLQAAAVPEPSTVALMLAGMLGVAGLKRRRAR